MTRIDKACYERGCACHDDRVDGETVEVVQREWQGLTDDEIWATYFDLPCTDFERSDRIDFVRAIEAKLKEKNT